MGANVRVSTSARGKGCACRRGGQGVVLARHGVLSGAAQCHAVLAMPLSVPLLPLLLPFALWAFALSTQVLLQFEMGDVPSGETGSNAVRAGVVLKAAIGVTVTARAQQVVNCAQATDTKSNACMPNGTSPKPISQRHGRPSAGDACAPLRPQPRALRSVGPAARAAAPWHSVPGIIYGVH